VKLSKPIFASSLPAQPQRHIYQAGAIQDPPPDSFLHGKSEADYAKYLAHCMTQCGIAFRQEVVGHYTWLPHWRTRDGKACRIDFVLNFDPYIIGVECKAPGSNEMNSAIHQSIDYVTFGRWSWPWPDTALDAVLIAPSKPGHDLLASLSAIHRVGMLYHRPGGHHVTGHIGYQKVLEWDSNPKDGQPWNKWYGEIKSGKKSGSR
jgi:hypothetical protein